MSDYIVERYQNKHQNLWNDFVLKSNQDSFLFHREFMDYHSDRFMDFSLMIYNNGILIALLPANRVDDKIFSHQGLTYGGLIYTEGTDRDQIEVVFQSIIEYLKKSEFTDVYIKSLPEFYDNNSLVVSEIMTDIGFEIYKTDRVLAVDYNRPLTIHKTKLKNYRKSTKKGFEIKETADLSLFWNEVLVPRLKEKHNAKPVHNLEEITLLKSRFPNKIRQFNIYLNDKIVAGITLFDKGDVVKSQYGATTLHGERTRALEYLFLHLIYHYEDLGKTYFSMGTVREDNELGYNPGLLKQKEELGCTSYYQNFFKLKL